MTKVVPVASPFGRILLITGTSEYLSDRTRARALASVREVDAGVQVSAASALGLSAAELIGLTSPSLFSETTAVVVTDLQDLPEEASTALIEYANEPSTDIAMILVHGGGNKGRGVLQKLRAAKTVHEVALKAPKYDNELAGWVRSEARDLGRSLDDRAASFLVTAVGSDLRALAGAVDQLVATTAKDEPLSQEVIAQYFGGRAQVKGYEIADAALAGRITVALEGARWAESAKLAPVLITSACASGLRSLAMVATAEGRSSDGDLAQRIGVPPFKIKSLRQVARAWTEEGLAVAVAAVAKADIDVKGGAAEPGWVVERLIIEIARARDI